MTSTPKHLSLKDVRNPLTKFLGLAAIAASLLTATSPAQGPLSVEIDVTTLQTYSGGNVLLDQAQRRG